MINNEVHLRTPSGEFGYFSKLRMEQTKVEGEPEFREQPDPGEETVAKSPARLMMMPLDQSPDAASEGHSRVLDELGLDPGTFFERHRCNHSSEPWLRECLFLHKACFRQVIAWRCIDFDEDHRLDIDASGQTGKIVVKVGTVESRHLLHPRIAKPPRVIKVDVRVDDCEVRQAENPLLSGWAISAACLRL